MNKDLVTVETQNIDYVLSPALGLEEARRRIKEVQHFVDELLIEGEDYGKIPGTDKPTLLKPGAEKLCNLFALSSHMTEVRQIEDWEGGRFYYVYDCELVNKKTGRVETNCTASANSKEERYRYRYEQRTCPSCGQATVIKGKAKWGGGWVCWDKKGGCGAKFKDGDESIESQAVGRVENDEPFTLVNTLQKMAQKRALVGATLIATGLSRRFTQDLEDIDVETLNGEPEAKPAKKGKKAKAPKADKEEHVSVQFWRYVREHNIDEGYAQELLAGLGNAFEQALEELKERSSD